MDEKPNKQAARSARTRDGLIEAARALFAERGFSAVAVEEVVRAAGVSRGALYHQFADKTELFAAVFERLEADVTGRLAATVQSAGEGDALDAISLAAREMLEIFADPGIERIVLIDAPSVLGWQRCREIAMRYGLGLVTQTLTAAMDAGQLRAGPTLPLAHLLIGALDEGALFVAGAPDPAAARREVAGTFEQLLDGLRATASTRPRPSAGRQPSA